MFSFYICIIFLIAEFHMGILFHVYVIGTLFVKL
jgi:hypothetical protein